jgi:MFS family permease
MGNFEYKFQKIISVFLIFIGAMLCVITLIPLMQFNFSYAYLLILTLFFAGLLVAFGGYVNYKKNTEQKNKEIELVHESNNATRIQITTATPILFRWDVSNTLWRNFSNLEKINRNAESVGMLIGICVLGTAFLLSGKTTNWKIALTISFVVGLIFVILRKVLTNQYLKTKQQQKDIVISFFENGVVVNENYYAFWHETRWLESVSLKIENEIQFLEFIVKWKTRDSIASDEIRIPYSKNEHQIVDDVTHYYNDKINQYLLNNDNK